MQKNARKNPKVKPYEELTITDDFMFKKVMAKPERCRRLLEILLNMSIRKIVFVESEKTIDMDYAKRGIRLDIYVEDEAHTVYNVEMQVENTGNLPKRSRYYQGLIDMNILEKGMSPKRLQKSLVIFICTFDLFEKGEYVYAFENRCRTYPELALEDGTQKLFINTRGRNHDMADEFVALMDYFNGKAATDEFTREVDEAVENIKNRVDLRVQYKSWNFTKAELLEEGLETGRREGLETGRREGLETGRREGKTQGETTKLIQQVCRKLAKGCAVDEIADMLEEEPETIRRIYEAAKKHAPDYDVQKIYEELEAAEDRADNQ